MRDQSMANPEHEEPNFGIVKYTPYRYLMYFSPLDKPVLKKEASDLGISMNRVVRRALHLYFKIPPATRHQIEYPHDL